MKLSFVEDIFVTKKGNKLGLIWCGKRQKTMVVLVHGMGGDAWAWHYLQADLWAHGVSSVAVDLLGHGLSSRPQNYQDYESDKVAAEVIEFIQAQSATEVVLVGHCYGGMIVQLVAPSISNCSKLIIIEAIFAWPRYLRWLLMGNWLSNLFYGLGRIFSTKHIHARRGYEGVRYDFDYSPRVKINDLRYTSGRSWFYTFSHVFRFNNLKRVKLLTQKIYLIWGKRDLIYNYACSDLWLEVFPKAQLVTLPLASHGAPLSHSDECADAVVRFLEG